MKSKIVALSKNEDFKNLLKKKKISNRYITVFFGPLMGKSNKKLLPFKPFSFSALDCIILMLLISSKLK